MQVIVTINYFVIFFIPKADRIASSGQVTEVRKLDNLVLAVVIDYRMRDSLPISICATEHKYIIREKLWFEIAKHQRGKYCDITFIIMLDVKECLLSSFLGINKTVLNKQY